MPTGAESLGAMLSRNVRFLLWKEELPRESWISSLRYRLPETWSVGDIRRLLNGDPLPYDRLRELAAVFGANDDELASSDRIHEAGVNVLAENLRFLLASVEHGGRKRLARNLGVDPTTVSRWASHRSSPPRSTLKQLAGHFGLPASTDLETEPVFLSVEPVAATEQRSWIRQRIDALSPDELRELYPALRRMLEER